MNAAKRNTELYRIAYQCGILRLRGCKGYCGNCQFNASLYIDDPREAVLIKTNAAIDAEQAENYRREEDAGFWAKIIAVVVFTLIFCWQCAKCSAPKETPPKPTVSIKYYTIDVVSMLPSYVRDVNGDGVINCIDYAVCFYELKPDSRIIRNQNPNTGWHHLFNAVPQPDGSWLYIEPNSAHSGSYSMKNIWGIEYDPRYNRNETHLWKGYAK